MCKLEIILLFVVIQLLLIFHLHVLSQEIVNGQESKSEQSKAYILPLVQIRYFNNFAPPTSIEFSTWKKGEKFLTAETIFSGSSPGAQYFLCGDDLNDEYCSFPVGFKKSDILQCTQEPKPFIEKLLIKDSKTFVDVPCGENGRGRFYQFLYKICQNSVSLQKEYSIKTLGKFETYRLCLDTEKKELLYTRHKLQSLDLLSDKRLKQERQISYDMITNGYTYFGSWFEEIKQRYDLLEKYGYKPMKLVPSNHFPLAVWKKPTYHYLNTMPIQKKLRKLWEHIFNRIREDGIQKKRQYEFYIRAFSIESAEKPAEEVELPDIWITIVKYIQRDDDEDFAVAAAIILNNKFERNPNFIAEFITNTYCKEDLCEKEFPEPFANISQSVYCCAVNDAIKQLFEEQLNIDRVLKPDFLFDSQGGSVEDSPQFHTVKLFVNSAPVAQLSKLISQTWQ